jgi:hypothetical protein
METLPPIILPGGGRFKSTGVLVSIKHQSAPEEDYVIRWRFSMNQAGRNNQDNGPTIEGRIPARPEVPFEECYQFASGGKMGYRRPSGQPFNLELGLPGVYRVYAWVERDGEPISATQSCVFEVLSGDTAPSVSLGC